MSAYYKIGDFAKEIGVSIQTLRNWDKGGKLKPAKVTDGGTRYYSNYQLQQYKGLSLTSEKSVIASSVNNMDLLENYLVSKGIKFKVVSNIIEMITLLESNNVERIFFYCKDDCVIDANEVASPSAFKLFKYICKSKGVEIEFVKEVIK